MGPDRADRDLARARRHVEWRAEVAEHTGYAGSRVVGASLADAALGAACCAALFAAFYVLGRLWYGPGALGGGDVSVAAFVGAVAGLSRLPTALVLASAISVGVALAVGLRARSRRASMPYAPALCLGALGSTLVPPG